jgi:hypothetical protein
MPRFPVSPQKQEELHRRMQSLQILEQQLDEGYFHAGDGMHGVHLTHKPTGIRVRCGRERSQGMNRFYARRLLVEELEARLHGRTRHEAKAERLRDEKQRRRHHPAAPPRQTPLIQRIAGDTAPSFADFMRRMSAYTLRPLEP